MKESKEAVRERVRRFRAKKKGVKPVTKVTPSVKTKEAKPVTQADIDLLPPSFKYNIDYVTHQRKVLKLPDNIKERTEQAVRRFRGY